MNIRCYLWNHEYIVFKFLLAINNQIATALFYSANVLRGAIG
jgi:hypothetical protein